MEKALEDAKERIIEIESSDQEEGSEGYDSFGDEYDSEEITDESFEDDGNMNESD